MMDPLSSKYVITGGPGAGKSTLIAGLQSLGYKCSAEVSRRVIVEEVNLGTSCLPWLDIGCFSVKVLHEMIAEWHKMPANEVSFFDRAIPDVIAYLKMADVAIPGEYYDQLRRHPYQKQVFILPPWKEIYVNDPERWQSYQEAVSIHAMIKQTYLYCGYTLLEVPALALADRVEFVLSHIK